MLTQKYRLKGPFIQDPYILSFRNLQVNWIEFLIDTKVMIGMIFKQLYLNDYLGLNLERGMRLKINKFKLYPLFSLYYKYSFQ